MACRVIFLKGGGDRMDGDFFAAPTGAQDGTAMRFNFGLRRLSLGSRVAMRAADHERQMAAPGVPRRVLGILP